MADFLQPDEIIQRLDIHTGMRVADFGAGAGHFAIPIARKVGETGHVSGLDVQKDMVEILAAKAKAENLLNIDSIWANLELPGGSKLSENSQDIVLISNTLFQADDKLAVIKEAFRILKPGGMLTIFEWERQDPPPGPPKNIRIEKRSVKEWGEQAGLTLARDIEAGSHHYGLIFKK